MEGILAIVLGITGGVILPVLAVAFIVYHLSKNRTTERLEMIRHGMILPAREKANPNKLVMMRNGCVAIGLGLGMLIGIIVINQFRFIELNAVFAFLASTILFLGLGYIAFYLLVRNKTTEE